MSDRKNSCLQQQGFFGAVQPKELLKKYGSPLYVYNENILRKQCKALKALCPLPQVRVCYATKTNSNLSLLRIIREEGLHVDAMSPGELAVTQKAGFSFAELSYVCNNVDASELVLGAEACHIVSVDSLSQVELFAKVCPHKPLMVRLNPGIGAGHHEKVVTAGKETKFGISVDDIPALHALVKQYGINLVGINQHVGSLYMEPAPFLDAAEWLLEVAETFPNLQYIDFGGGFGIPYHKHDNEAPLDMQVLGEKLTALLTAWIAKTGYKGEFFIEPGRFAVAECAVVLGTVVATKQNSGQNFVGTDIGFNVLMRPVLYDSYHDIEVFSDSSNPNKVGDEAKGSPALLEQTVVGNICESGDILAQKRLLPAMQEGDVVAVLDAGAYGFAMSSSYNLRLRPAEVLIDETGADRLIRYRQTIENILQEFPEA